MKKWLIASIAIFVSLFTTISMCVDVEASISVEEIQEKGTLVLGTSADYPPYEFHASVDGQDTIMGMDISLAQALADELGVDLQIEDLGFDALLPALESGSVDVVLAGMSPTPEREESVDFSDIYYIDESLLVVLDKNKDQFSSREDLEGKVIGAQTGSIQAGFADQMEGETYLLSDNNQLIIALQTEKVAGLVMNGSTAQIFQENRGDLHLIDGHFEGMDTEGNAMAFRKGSDDVIEVANQVIAEAQENDQFDQWLSEVAPYIELDDGEESQGFLQEYWPYFWEGAKTTILIAVVGVLFGMILGILLAVMRMSDLTILRGLGSAYVEFVRGTPLLIQVLFIYFGIGMFVNIPALISGMIAMSLNSGAYIAEIIRSGLGSLPRGQSEAARSLGLSYGQTMRHVVFPQALRNIWPALGNEFVTVIKESSIISTIGVAELAYQTNIVQTSSYKGILPLFISMIIYFILTYTLTKVLNYYENKMSYDK